MSIGDMLDRVNWFFRLLLGEYAKVLAVFLTWQAGLPVSIFVQIGQTKFRFKAQEAPEAGVRRRLIIDELA